MANLIVGIDVDGVLAKWDESYADLLTKHTGIVFPKDDPTWPSSWEWPTLAGVTREQENQVWDDVIKPSDRFWQNLPAYLDARAFLTSLVDSDFCDNVYFITSRAGRNVKAQTEYWLDQYGFPYATVLISKEKGMCAKALKLTHYIDDRDENCVDVYTNSGAKCYMLARPWNQLQNGVPRLNNLAEFWEVLNAEA